jgi:hypothetical protein
MYSLYSWSPIVRNPVRRNSDERVRQLERAAAGGDMDAALRLYWELIRSRGERDTEEFPSYEISLPKLGLVGLQPRGPTLRVFSPAEGGVQEAVTVNRVDYHVSGYYSDTPGYGWIPFDRDEVEKRVAEARSYGREPREDWGDPAYRWHNTVSLSRVQWTDYRKRDASEAAFAKFMKILDRAVQAWITDHPGEMRLAARIRANNDMVRVHRESAALREKLAKADALLAQLMVEELRNS